jgi:hypothetical protein
MISKVGVVAAVVIVASVVFLAIGSRLWAPSWTPTGPLGWSAGASDPATDEPVGNDGRKISPEHSSSKTSGANQSGSRTGSEAGALGSDLPGRDNASTTGANSEFEGSPSPGRTTHERDRKNSSDRGETGEQDQTGRGDSSPALPSGLPSGISGADPSGPDAAGPTLEELERTDLDLDEEISPWEIEKTRRLDRRAENYPRRNDNGDGAYPIEQNESPMSEDSFDNIDTNGDDQLDKDEYYMHLVRSEANFMQHDKNGNGQISHGESKLSTSEFKNHDTNHNNTLSDLEWQKVVAAGDDD